MPEYDHITEPEWLDIYAELRLLVASSGFSEWDVAADAAISEGGEDRAFHGGRGMIVEYAKAFDTFLEVRSESNLARLREGLASLLEAENGQPVTEAAVSFGEDLDGNDLFRGSPSEDLRREIRHFVMTIIGEGFEEGEPA